MPTCALFGAVWLSVERERGWVVREQRQHAWCWAMNKDMDGSRERERERVGDKNRCEESDQKK